MSALAEAVSTQDLLTIRELLTGEVEDRLRYAAPGLVSSSALVCLMWSTVLVSAAPGSEDAEAIARCMLADTLALLGSA